MTRKETEIDIYEPEKMDMEGIGMYEGYTHMANIFLTGGSEELQQNIWEILEQEPECDGGVTNWCKMISPSGYSDKEHKNCRKWQRK